MTDTYSLYDAKAKFSAILAKVRGGRTVYVSYRGTPVAEIRPIAPAPSNLADHLQRMADQGTLVRPAGPRPKITPGKKSPGALRRFLDERDQ